MGCVSAVNPSAESCRRAAGPLCFSLVDNQHLAPCLDGATESRTVSSDKLHNGQFITMKHMVCIYTVLKIAKGKNRHLNLNECSVFGVFSNTSLSYPVSLVMQFIFFLYLKTVQQPSQCMNTLCYIFQHYQLGMILISHNSEKK